MADGQIFAAPSAIRLQSTILASVEPGSKLRRSADAPEPAADVVRNAALLARNDLLQKALERQQAKSADLRRILSSIDIPIVCLCPRLMLRFFTPEAGLLLGLTRGDIGAPLARATALDPDGALLARVRAVLNSGSPDALHIETASKQRFLCRLLPLNAIRSDSTAIDGVTLAFISAPSVAVAVAEPEQLSPLFPPSGNLADRSRSTGIDGGGVSAGHPALGFGLTQRQHQVLGHVLAGHPSKNIAADLGISRRTVENHRAAIMARTGATSLPALARIAIGADVGGDCKTMAGH